MMVSDSFIAGCMYVWGKLEPDLQVSLYGFPFKSSNFPWAFLVLTMITGGDFVSVLIGIAAGHSYVFLKLILPRSHGY